MRRKLRVAAYAICVRDDQLLLARWTDGRGRPEWTLPGGGVEHGEDPYDAALREVEEETGYHVDLTALLGVDSIRRTAPRSFGRSVEHHGIRLVYEGRVAGGELRHEVGGSTDMAAWHPLETVPGLRRVALVDAGLALWRERPAAGRVNCLQYPER
ncbi:NUDIX hydrolase [Streptomyces sp. NPDC051172]|uniref:NUDIX hydrolase n=1 Tax=Streptomyces sp. NPDC051172 TaxID=3155796 RepID=UPI00343B0606